MQQKRLALLKHVLIAILMLSIGFSCTKNPSVTPTPEPNPGTPPPSLPDFLKNFSDALGGTFRMGSPDGTDGTAEVGRNSDEVPHNVFINDYYIAKYDVTVAEFMQFVKTTGYSYDTMSKKPRWGWINNHPIVNVSWFDATRYCNYISKQYKLDTVYSFYPPGVKDINGNDSVKINYSAKGFRLPTEAEWEYACRTNFATAFSTGINITTDQANYNGEKPYDISKSDGIGDDANGKQLGMTSPVGSYPPNFFKLYDMHGNIWQWCQDRYGTYFTATDPVNNPLGAETSSIRVARGGSWVDYGVSLRSAERNYDVPGNHNDYVGFRLAKTK